MSDDKLNKNAETGSEQSLSNSESDLDILKDQICPFCHSKTLTLIENERNIPYFGKMFIFSMECSNCGYFHADIESDKEQEPSKYKFKVEKSDDLTVRVIKSAKATIKIPHIMTITPGPVSNGYVTNIEGILNRVEKMLEEQYEAEEDNDKKKKLKNMIKKIHRAKAGFDPLEITIEDPTGSSAIISDKAIKSKL